MVQNEIFLNNETFIIAEAKVEDCLFFDGAVVVLLNARELKSDQNIVCYSLEREFKWRIPEPSKLHFDNYYTSIYSDDSISLMAYNKNGLEVTIDRLDGSILKSELIK